jgi:hypothetical protein
LSKQLLLLPSHTKHSPHHYALHTKQFEEIGAVIEDILLQYQNAFSSTYFKLGKCNVSRFEQ